MILAAVLSVALSAASALFFFGLGREFSWREGPREFGYVLFVSACMSAGALALSYRAGGAP